MQKAQKTEEAERLRERCRDGNGREKLPPMKPEKSAPIFGDKKFDRKLKKEYESDNEVYSVEEL